MDIARNIAELTSWLGAHHNASESLGFIPTMGALHQGHLSLIRQSLGLDDYTVCSIFVNPIQFNNPDDLAKYPRMPEIDIRMLSDVGCNLLFIPSAEEMYPEIPKKIYDFGSLDKVMEGAFRPGHFNGVAIVVNRLFQLIRPDRAYFGLKDFQQYLIIKEMVRQDKLPVEIVGHPIIREDDGLAMSSRNIRLTPEQRGRASVIFKALSEAQKRFRSFSPEQLQSYILNFFDGIPECRPEYVSVADANTLQPVRVWMDAKSAVVCAAVFFGDIRLIDNILLY